MENKRRVIVDFERMKYPYTGLYTFCKELGLALTRNNSTNTNLVLYIPAKELSTFGSNANILKQSTAHKLFKSALSNCEVWHTTHQASAYLPGKQKVKIVATIHDLNFLHGDKNVLKIKKYLGRLQRLIDRADHIVAISNFVKEEIISNMNTHGKLIDVVYNGRNTIPPVFTKPGDIDDTPFFFAVGTIARKKNFHVLPAMLCNNDLNLVIAGITQDENYKQKIFNEAKILGVENRVKLIGTVTEEEKYWLLKNCRAFAFPSIAEGFGLPVIEAMQLGTPVLLSKATSLPEIGGPHALYFDDLSTESVKASTAKLLRTNFSLKDRENIIAWTEKFSWDHAAKSYLEIYNSFS